jgi:hypothetical protein
MKLEEEIVNLRVQRNLLLSRMRILQELARDLYEEYDGEKEHCMRIGEFLDSIDETLKDFREIYLGPFIS